MSEHASQSALPAVDRFTINDLGRVPDRLSASTLARTPSAQANLYHCESEARGETSCAAKSRLTAAHSFAQLIVAALGRKFILGSTRHVEFESRDGRDSRISAHCVPGAATFARDSGGQIPMRLRRPSESRPTSGRRMVLFAALLRNGRRESADHLDTARASTDLCKVQLVHSRRSWPEGAPTNPVSPPRLPLQASSF